MLDHPSFFCETVSMKNNHQITKAQAVGLYGGNQAALARALGIQRAAVCRWSDGPIPERHALKLRFVLRPEVFDKNA